VERRRHVNAVKAELMLARRTIRRFDGFDQPLAQLSSCETQTPPEGGSNPQDRGSCGPHETPTGATRAETSAIMRQLSALLRERAELLGF
jgi:hypothetical protein